MYDDMTEPPDVLTRLRERHAELVRAIRETGFADNPPPLRDRHPFFHWLLNGARDTYEQVRPRWQEYKRNVENAARLEDDINTVIRGKVMEEPGYRALGAQADKELTAVRSCRQLIQSIRAARDEITRITTKTPDDAVRVDVKRDENEVSNLLDEVRRHLDDLRRLPAGAAVQSVGLRIEFSRGDSPKRRNKKYSDIGASLGSLQKNVNSVLGEVAKRASKALDDQRHYLAAGIARYKHPSDGRG
jgi:hypothetical protein